MITIHEVTAPSGLCYLQIDLEGRIEVEDARTIEARVLPGQPHHRGYLLPRIAKGTEYSPEARKFFGTLKDKCRAVAMVVTSPLVRAAVNLMLRYSGVHGDLLRMFMTEAEALEWLESRWSSFNR